MPLCLAVAIFSRDGPERNCALGLSCTAQSKVKQIAKVIVGSPYILCSSDFPMNASTGIISCSKGFNPLVVLLFGLSVGKTS